LKPDVVAPGYYTVSATANPTTTSCAAVSFTATTNVGVKSLSGTSMATPTLAGELGLVRQYFVEGFYPSGKKNLGNAFNPSASLLKAISIAGAVNQVGTKTSTSTTEIYSTDPCPQTTGQKPLPPRPYFQQGFGRTQLNDVLYFGSGDRLLHIPSAVNNASAFFDRPISTGEEHTYTYCLFASTEETRVALVWTDLQSSINAEINLVNNLDLTVVFKGTTLTGNSQGTMLTDIQEPIDNLNNAEMVYYTGNTAGEGKQTMTIKVKGTAVPSGPQLYSLVLTGAAAEGDCNAVGSTPTAPLSFLTKSAGVFAQPSILMMVVIMLLALVSVWI